MPANWVRLAGVLALCSGLSAPPTAAQPQAAQRTPGFLVRLYQVDTDLRMIPDLVSGQAPSAVLTLDRLELKPGAFGGLQDRFVTDVSGWLDLAQGGLFEFRLTSDDGAKLWIDNELLIDHDGLHGGTDKVAGRMLAGGVHSYRVLHFDAGADELLRLEIKPPANSEFSVLGKDMAFFDAAAPRATSPGPKRVIPALRRGRPGDGAPHALMHPYFTIIGSAGETTSPRGLEGTPFAGVHILTGREQQAAAPLVYFPPERDDPGLLSLLLLRSGPYAGQVLAGADRRRGLYRLQLDEQAGLITGCFFRFGDGLGGAVAELRVSQDELVEATVWDRTQAVGDRHMKQYLHPRQQVPFEMQAVRVLSNGLEIQFTQPLDPRAGWEPEGYYIEQLPFDAAGGQPPQRDGVVYTPRSASVSADRKTVFLEIPDLKPRHVAYLRLLPPCFSEAGELPWGSEAWCTIVELPRGNAGQPRQRPPEPPQNLLTEEERAAGWKLLFDGQDLAQWRGFQKPDLPPGWQALDGCLVRTGGGGDIITRAQFENFELKLDWRISVGGNSGIFFRVSEAPPNRFVWETGPEMQVLDNAEHPDGRTPLTSAGANYALQAPLNDVTRVLGLFNEARLVVRGNHVEHWLNGAKIVEYELGDADWQRRVRLSKFSSMPRYGTVRKGHIALQDHGDKVWFRNIKIRELPAD